MLKRKFTNYLKQWKATKQKECLLVCGARQIGKTFIIEDFARNNYESFIELNFEQFPTLKSAFDGDLTVMFKDPWYWRVSAVFSIVSCFVFFAMVGKSQKIMKRIK